MHVMGGTFSLPDEGRQVVEDDLPVDATTSHVEPAADTGRQQAKWTGPRCEKCGAPIKSDMMLVCRSCGWYARLGMYVDVNPQWEEEEDEDGQPVVQPPPSHLRVWLGLLPPWAWILIASVVVVIIESVVARLVTPTDSRVRTIWSLVQLGSGALVFVGFHMFNFLTVAADDADMGVIDLVLKPFKTWTRTFRGLPARLWVVDAAACGLTAAVMSLAVIGGIPYHVLWDWGFKEPPKPNLMGAVLSQMQKAEDKGADDLEDAVSDFANSQDLDSQQPKPKPVPARPRERADCVILGYRVGEEGRITMLILATSHHGKLVYAGHVVPQLSDEEMADLARKLNSVKTTRPFLPLHTTATWVDPKFTCRVTFRKRSQGGGLIDIQWDRLLGELRGL
jgi:hypothetical protein